jgi:hypothetical protein
MQGSQKKSIKSYQLALLLGDCAPICTDPLPHTSAKRKLTLRTHTPQTGALLSENKKTAEAQ